MSSPVIGKWKLVSSENFDEFMKALGVGMVLRKLAGSSKPVVDISVNGDEWTIRTETTIKSSEYKFKLGQESEQERMDGVKVKFVVSLEDDKLIEKHLGDKEVIFVREVVNGELKVTCTLGNVESVRVYQKA